jgi:hypothetical protein
MQKLTTYASRIVALTLILGLVIAAGFANGQGQADKAKGKAPAKPDVKKDEEKDAGPPASIPPPEAKGYKLAQFIKAQLAKGATGESLAAAINKERGKLGLTDDDKDDDPPSPGKGKKQE